MRRENSENNPLAIMGPLTLLWEMAAERMHTYNTWKRRRLRLKEVYRDFIDSECEFLHFTCLFFQRL